MRENADFQTIRRNANTLSTELSRKPQLDTANGVNILPAKRACSMQTDAQQLGVGNEDLELVDRVCQHSLTETK